MFDWSWALVIGGALLVLAEVAFGGFAGFDLVLIGSAFILGGALGLVTGNPQLGMIVASALCVLYILIGRRFVRARMRTRHVPSNIDAVVGSVGTVLLRVAPHAPGQVKVNDEIWRAEMAPDAPGPMEAGSVVTVAGVNGVTLQVR